MGAAGATGTRRMPCTRDTGLGRSMWGMHGARLGRRGHIEKGQVCQRGRGASGVVAGHMSGARGPCLWLVGMDLACEGSRGMGLWRAWRMLAGMSSCGRDAMRPPHGVPSS